MKLYIPTFILLLLTACGQTSTGNLIRSTFQDKAAEIAAEGLKNSEWFVCRGASIGSVKDRYGQTQEGANSYNAFCDADGTIIQTDVE
ncbi:hypothetical protein LCGC14_2406370 [marine sediment metagenome]|uniref:Uncharacterized protein n=1 Tax=marine sediment metagenome TaxID=412755 RepID=A0A0F9BTU2_9ZZZZ